MSPSAPRKQFVISVLSRDRVGIIAQVSSAVSSLQGDIADLRESVLRGYLTMIFLVTFPGEQTAEALRERLQALNTPDQPRLDFLVQPADDAAPPDQPGVPPNAGGKEHRYVLTASGRDRIGFVATVSSFCARHNINILDLSTAVTDGSYIMILLVDLSRCPDLAEIRRQLKAFGQESGLCLVLQHYDIFKATNEVSVL